MPLEMPAERSTATSQPVTVCTCTSKALSSGGKFTHMRATPTPADANYELVGTGELSESQGADAPDDDATPSELLGPLLEWPDLISLVLNRLNPGLRHARAGGKADAGGGGVPWLAGGEGGRGAAQA